MTSNRLPTLRSQLVRLAAALLIPALAAAGLTLYGSYVHSRQEVEKHLQETARALSLVVDRQFGQAEAILWALSASPLLRSGDYRSLDAYARDIARIPGAWVVVEEPGRQVVNTRLPVGAPLPEIGTTEHWKGMAPGEIRVSNLFTGIVAKQPAVAIDTLVAADGTQRYLSVIMLAETVSRTLAEQNLPPGWAGAILDRNGTVVGRAPRPDRFVGRPATPDNLERVRSGVSRGVFESVNLEGVATVLALARSPSSGWTMIVAVPRAELIGGIRQLALYLAGAAGLLAAIGAFVALRVARRIANPVEALAIEVQALGAGTPVASANGTGPDFQETAALRQAFDRSSSALRQREAERDRAYTALQDANATLEARVESRTRALAQANADLQESQAALAEREALYASVFRYNADGLFVLQVSPDGQLIVETCNPAVEELMGRPAEEARGLPLEDVAPAHFYPLMRTRLQECLERAEPITYERQHTFGTRAGTWAVTLVPIRGADGRIVRILGSNRDVTREREAEAEIKASRDRYSALFEQSPLDLAVIDIEPDGGFVYRDANPTLLQSLGLTRDAFVGLKPREVFGTEVAAYVEAHYRRCVTTRASVDYEVSGRVPAGDVVRRTVLVPILGSDGEVRKIFVTSMDLTEQRRMEERLRNSERLETVGQLTGGIAHDFNNLLTVVMGNLDMLRRAKPERAPRLIANALAAVEQGRRLTSQLLAFSRRQPLKAETAEAGSLIREMTDMLAQSLRGDIVLEIDAAEGLWPVEVDPTQLQAALINLAANARDAMPDGGTFRVRARNRVSQDGSGVEGVAIQVSDTGVGIPPADLPRVFEPFFTTKEVGKGTGLGLAQVYGFVQQSGGTVDIMSEAGRGTTVTLVLPRASKAPSQATPDVPRSVRLSPALRILLVEDNPQLATLAADLLAEQGHSVDHAHTAPEALAQLRRDAQYDLIFSDLVMPGGMSGLELARLVRRQWPWIPVLLATGYSTEATRAQSEGFRLLTKPYQPSELAAALAEMAVEAAPGARIIPLRPS